MKNENETTGITFMDLLQILFIGLRLTGVISWSWIWVLAPMWIPLGIWIISVLVISRKRRKGKDD